MPGVSPNPETLIAHVPGLRRYARLLVGDVHRADDLVQDTLERACRALERWPETSRQRAWLLSVMHNLFVDQVRARRPLDGAAPLDDALEATLPSRADAARSVQLRIDIERGLMQLPLAQREVLLLVCVADCAYDEAATILGVPVGTVMSRLSRARAQLRIELDEPPGAAPRLHRVK
ncbi:MAG: RNA polymerase sigma factor [Burkholderiales bacterium]|nr:MAG: RNA polymerase sigma factor [Burkholderiales bacterium]